MDLPSLIRKQLGEVDFISLVPDFLFSDQKECHLSFYQITVDEDRVPKAEVEHMDKKLSRLEILVRSMKKDIKDLEKFMADNKNHGGGTAMWRGRAARGDDLGDFALRFGWLLALLGGPRSGRNPVENSAMGTSLNCRCFATCR